MTQQVHTQPHVVPPLLDIATVSDHLTEIYNGFAAQKDTENTAAFAKMAKNGYLGWRGDQAKANDFLNAARALLAPPAPVEEVDPWDLGEPEVEAAPVAVQATPAPAPVPVVQETEEGDVPADVKAEQEETDTEAAGEPSDDDLEGEDDTQVEAEADPIVEVAPAPEPVTAAPVIVTQPDADPSSLFGQLRALFDRGTGSGFRIMSSFLPNGQQRLVIIDEHLSAQKLDTFSLTATDTEFDTELAPLLSEHLAGPAHTVRTLAAQAAQAAKTQAASSKKPVTPAKTTTPAPAAKPAAKPAPISSAAKITLTPPVPASGSYDGPSNGKVKFANGAATLMSLKPGEYTLKVTADGHLDAEQKFTVAGSGTMTVPVTLVSAGLDF